jgi:SSS family solute:Na+ symporter
VHAKEAVPLGLCKSLFGRPSLFPALANVDPIVVALPISTVVFIVVSLCTRPVPAEVADKAFRGVKTA